jgi:hypothetical protein
MYVLDSSCQTFHQFLSFWLSEVNISDCFRGGASCKEMQNKLSANQTYRERLVNVTKC